MQFENTNFESITRVDQTGWLKNVENFPIDMMFTKKSFI